VPPTRSQRRLRPLAQELIEMCVRFANGAARLRIIVQLYAQAAKRDAEKAGGVRTIAVAAYKHIENMLALDLG
jgi:hypothetical protein